MLTSAFEAADFTPHGFCLSWEPALIGLHVVSDAVIALSYYSIPIALCTLVLRRRDLAFGWMFWLFALFILACGTTHVFGIWTLWRPDYWSEGLVKALTAGGSAMTAILLWPMIPKALAVPSPAALEAVNLQLMQQVAERDAAVEALRLESVERRRTEKLLQQAQKMEAVGQLSGGIAHDFNNLLMVIQGNLELLRERIGEAPAAKYVDRALAGSNRGAILTQQLLAFARRQDLRPVSFDVRGRIAAMLPILRVTLGDRVQVELCAGEDECRAEADPHQLENAILNLAINARDAMPRGGRFSIAVENRRIVASDPPDMEAPEPGDYVMITVTDTGSGMTEEVRRAAFEPFFTTKPVGKGSGLGLSQVYGFAKQSRGHVAIRSEVGKGTSVTICLRRAMEDDEG
jgi:signal transduction histidine kinase